MGELTTATANTTYTDCLSPLAITSPTLFAERCAYRALTYLNQSVAISYRNCSVTLNTLSWSSVTAAYEAVEACVINAVTPYIGQARALAANASCIGYAIRKSPLAIAQCVKYALDLKFSYNLPLSNTIYSSCAYPIIQGNVNAAKLCLKVT
jgi:hypothetical protein